MTIKHQIIVSLHNQRSKAAPSLSHSLTAREGKTEKPTQLSLTKSRRHKNSHRGKKREHREVKAAYKDQCQKNSSAFLEKTLWFCSSQKHQDFPTMSTVRKIFLSRIRSLKAMKVMRAAFDSNFVCQLCTKLHYY